MGPCTTRSPCSCRCQHHDEFTYCSLSARCNIIKSPTESTNTNVGQIIMPPPHARLHCSIAPLFFNSKSQKWSYATKQVRFVSASGIESSELATTKARLDLFSQHNGRYGWGEATQIDVCLCEGYMPCFFRGCHGKVHIWASSLQQNKSQSATKGQKNPSDAAARHGILCLSVGLYLLRVFVLCLFCLALMVPPPRLLASSLPRLLAWRKRKKAQQKRPGRTFKCTRSSHSGQVYKRERPSGNLCSTFHAWNFTTT